MKNLKIGILTHPLSGNFGGMLQAYALHSVLKNMGYHPFILDRDLKHKTGKRDKIRNLWFYIRRLIASCPLNFPLPFFIERRAGKKFQNLKSADLNIVHLSQLEKIREKNTIQWVIGSDQVWRGIYARWICDLSYFFLDFVPERERLHSISYAASFGSDAWEGSSQETEICKELIHDLKAVSVRENSGIDICRNVFQTKAVQMPDPTFLLTPKEYDALIESSKTEKCSCDYIASYVLDTSELTLSAIQNVSKLLSLPLQHIMPIASAKKRKERFPMSVPQWLRYIRDCKYLITDSFHGCVFAIIFNKPFVCVGNEARGMARFNTLFKTFGLEHHLVHTISSKTLQKPATNDKDWENINAILSSERDRGLCFLRQNLN